MAVTQRSVRNRYTLDGARTAVLVEARSNVGTVAFGTGSVTGCIEVARGADGFDVASDPRGRLRVPVASLRSGNALYDAELHTRLDAQRYPQVDVELVDATGLGRSRYRLRGRMTLHGVTCELAGGVVVTMSGRTLEVTGEEVIDVRDFGIELPSVLMLRIYPEVRVQLQLLAHVDLPPEGV